MNLKFFLFFPFLFVLGPFAQGAAPACAELLEKRSLLFSQETPVELELAADFTYVRDAAEGGNWTGEDRSDAKYYSQGILRDLKNPQVTFPVQVRARGMSSLQSGEASFPKLRVEIRKEQSLDGTIFKGSRNFRINTHVATDPKSQFTEMGRLNSELSPWREGLAYQLAETLGLFTPATQLANIQYKDLKTNQNFKRQALLLETDKKTIERLGAVEVNADDVMLSEVNPVNAVEAARFFLFHAMIANEDVNLRVHEPTAVPTEKYRPLFNTYVVNTASRKGAPVVYDLDLSRFVSGADRFGDWTDMAPFQLNNKVEWYAARAISKLRQRFSAEELRTAILETKSKKAAIERRIQTAFVDDKGRELAKIQVESFFRVLDLAVGYQVLNSAKLQFYKDATSNDSKMKLDPLSEENGTLRPGTPVVILKKEMNRLKVAILDLHGDVDDPSTMPVGYIDANAKISPNLDPSFIGVIDGRDMTW